MSDYAKILNGNLDADAKLGAELAQHIENKKAEIVRANAEIEAATNAIKALTPKPKPLTPKPKPKPRSRARKRTTRPKAKV